MHNLSDWETKVSILKAKRDRLYKQNIFIDCDRSESESKIEFKICKCVRAERSKEKSAFSGHRKIQID